MSDISQEPSASADGCYVAETQTLPVGETPVIDLNPSEPDPVLTWVRGELQRFGQVIATEMETLRSDLESERSTRAGLEEQIATIAAAVESNDGSSAGQTEFVSRLETWVAEFEQASDQRNSHLVAQVETALSTVDSKLAQHSGGGSSSSEVKDLELRQEQVEAAMESTRTSLVQFDEQAARMVSYFSESVDSMRSEIAEIADGQAGDVEGRFVELEAKADEALAVAGRAADEAGASVKGQIDSAEDRVNSRMMALEMRVQEDIGVRVADIDAHVGRMSLGLDDSVTMINDRIAAVDGKFGDLEADLASTRTMIENVDEEAIDEMKEKISSALGQAELVRIEMERFEETINERLEKTATRLTEVETTVQDQAMDVETAVQLERLEEVERAVLMLDPDVIQSRDAADHDDATVAMTRPAASEPAMATPEAPQPMADPMLPPSASAPLSPPTADPTRTVEPAAQQNLTVDNSMTLEPPVNF